MSPDRPNRGNVTGMTTAADAPAEPEPCEPCDDILRELDDCRQTIDAADKARDRRLELWLQARRETNLTFAKLAQMSGVAEPYVIRVVGKATAQPAPPVKKRRRT